MSSPWVVGFGVAAFALLSVGVVWGLAYAPPDYQQGNSFRIMYVHVPTAWLSQFVYASMAVSALGTLIWRHPMADVSMKAAAPLALPRFGWTGDAIVAGCTHEGEEELVLDAVRAFISAV